MVNDRIEHAWRKVLPDVTDGIRAGRPGAQEGGGRLRVYKQLLGRLDDLKQLIQNDKTKPLGPDHAPC